MILAGTAETPDAGGSSKSAFVSRQTVRYAAELSTSYGGRKRRGGGTPTGGVPSTGGGTPTGGVPSTGGGVPSTGGGTATGGVPPTGGGGVPSTGGGKPTGGDPSTGGGKPTGGDPSTGGGKPTGGDPSTGGGKPTGGDPSTGGGKPTGASGDPPGGNNPGLPPASAQLPTVPKLTRSVATSRVKSVLSRRFGRAYTAGNHKRVSCRPQGASTYVCSLSWRYHRQRYNGRAILSPSGPVKTHVVSRRR
jgi:hypothetical protein